MSSPFPPNATLVFQLPADSSQIDALGNPIAPAVDLVVACYLKEGKGSAKGDPLDGGNIARIPLEGRIVGEWLHGAIMVPLPELPAAILPGAKAFATINRAGGDITGDFFLEASIPSAFGVDAVLGGKIRGYLVQAIAWGEAL